MQISIIIPTYKPQAYILKCLESLAAQTFDKSQFEVIVILNGCREPYYSWLQEFIDKNMDGNNVTLIQTDIPGVSNARNIGIDKASGQYVTFVDDDDFVSPNYLKGLFDVASPDSISLCYPYVFNDGKETAQLDHMLTHVYDKYCYRRRINLLYGVRKYFSGPCMKLIPREYIQDRRFNTEFKNGEDSLFMFLISDKFDKFAFADKSAIYHRRIRQGSAVTSFKPRSVIIKNSLMMMREYTWIYFSGFPRYSFHFYITRLLGAVRSMFSDAYSKSLNKNLGGGYELTPLLQAC